MKKTMLLVMVLALFTLSACGDKGMDLSKLSACGECVEGLNDLATAQSMQKSLDGLPVLNK